MKAWRNSSRITKGSLVAVVLGHFPTDRIWIVWGIGLSTRGFDKAVQLRARRTADGHKRQANLTCLLYFLVAGVGFEPTTSGL